jgi:large subunit ribosomal protein L3
MSINGIIGKKIGSTSYFLEDGSMIGVTAVTAGPCKVSQIKLEETDGYNAVQLAYEDVSKTTLPLKGHFQKLGDVFYRYMREFSVTESSNIELGSDVDISIFNVGDKINVTGFSKGRGFAGVVKRYGFAGGPKTHGQSDRWRAPGSIGAGSSPGRVWKGKKMPGHMGNTKITVRNLEIVSIDTENSIVLLKGSLPGAKNSLVLLRKNENGI